MNLNNFLKGKPNVKLIEGAGIHNSWDSSI